MPTSDRRGFTLIEMLIAMTVGVLVLTLASQIVLTVTKSVSNGDARASVDRNARFLGLSLQRDLQEAGVDLESTVDFGSVQAYGDTLVLLRVPYDSGATGTALPSSEYPSRFTTRPIAGQGTCGARCLDVDRGASAFQPVVGDVVLLQVANQRRLAVVGTATTGSTTATITWPAMTSFLGRSYGLANPDIRLDAQPLANLVRRLEATMYFQRGDSLIRATRFNAITGLPDGQVIATGVNQFRVRLTFINGDSAATSNGTDANANNDPNDVTGVTVTTVLTPDPNDIRRGYSSQPKTFRWFVAPRNLAYERNRI